MTRHIMRSNIASNFRVCVNTGNSLNRYTCKLYRFPTIAESPQTNMAPDSLAQISDLIYMQYYIHLYY